MKPLFEKGVVDGPDALQVGKEKLLSREWLFDLGEEGASVAGGVLGTIVSKVLGTTKVSSRIRLAY